MNIKFFTLAVIFSVTLGLLWFTDNKNNGVKQENVPESEGGAANLFLEANLGQITASASAAVEPTQVSTPTPTPTSSPTATPSPTPLQTPHVTATPTQTITSATPIPIEATPAATPTPSSDGASATPIPSPTPEITPTPTEHLWYTSSHSRARYYYCDTDTAWKSLSPDYLKVFNSQKELLAQYSRTLHEECSEE